MTIIMKGPLVSHCNLWPSHYKPINRLYQEWNKDHSKFSSPSPSPYFISITTRYQHDSPEAIGSFRHLPKLAPPQVCPNSVCC